MGGHRAGEGKGVLLQGVLLKTPQEGDREVCCTDVIE